jgi:hypothetical protein
MKEVIIPIDIYRAKAYIWIGKPEEAEKKYKTTQLFKENFEVGSFQYSDAKYMWHEATSRAVDPIIWVSTHLKRDKKISALTHEFSHLIFDLFNDRGIKVSANNDEQFTYLLTYLTDKILPKI